jgi:hypothetical protein
MYVSDSERLVSVFDKDNDGIAVFLAPEKSLSGVSLTQRKVWQKNGENLPKVKVFSLFHFFPKGSLNINNYRDSDWSNYHHVTTLNIGKRRTSIPALPLQSSHPDPCTPDS